MRSDVLANSLIQQPLRELNCFRRALGDFPGQFLPASPENIPFHNLVNQANPSRFLGINRPGAEGVPFFFIRVDPAGNVSKRLDGAGFPFAAHGGGCPLWNLHGTFRNPGQLMTQWLELPDGQRFFSVAQTVNSGGGSWERPMVRNAVALACAAEHAHLLVYAKNLEVNSVTATPIGVSCRLCPRATCTARAAPPIGREILADDQRRAPAPYVFAEG